MANTLSSPWVRGLHRERKFVCIGSSTGVNPNHSSCAAQVVSQPSRQIPRYLASTKEIPCFETLLQQLLDVTHQTRAPSKNKIKSHILMPRLSEIAGSDFEQDLLPVIGVLSDFSCSCSSTKTRLADTRHSGDALLWFIGQQSKNCSALALLHCFKVS